MPKSTHEHGRIIKVKVRIQIPIPTSFYNRVKMDVRDGVLYISSLVCVIFGMPSLNLFYDFSFEV